MIRWCTVPEIWCATDRGDRQTDRKSDILRWVPNLKRILNIYETAAVRSSSLKHKQYNRHNFFISMISKTENDIIHQGVFQALLHTTVFVFQIEFVKVQRPFLTLKTWKISRGSAEHCKPPPGPGDSLSGAPRGEAPQSSAYLGFENLLL